MERSKTIESILEEHPDIREAVESDRSLYDHLRNVYDAEYGKYRLAIKGYEIVDKADKYLATAETLLRLPGPGPNMLLYAGIRGTELIGKGIASLYYGSKTGDWKGVGALAGMEAAETVAPFGEAANVLPTYRMRAQKMLKDKVVKEFKDRHLDSGNLRFPRRSDTQQFRRAA